MKQYAYYLFDIDRTLWDFDTNARNAIFHTLDRFSRDPRLAAAVAGRQEFFDRYETVNHALWHRYERGEITKEELRGERFYLTFLQFYGIDDREFAETFGQAYLDRMPVETALIPGARTVLETLRRRGCRIAAVSNGFKEVQYRKLENSGILPFFDAILISEEVGCHKPRPDIFRTALERLAAGSPAPGLREIKRQALMVGDDFANDIEGAQVFGIDQFYFNPRHRPCDGGPTYESDNLLDLIGNGTAAG